MLKQLSESELLNLQLKEDLATRDSENAALGQKVSHTGRLQKAFEDLQGQMKVGGPFSRSFTTLKRLRPQNLTNFIINLI